MLNTLPTGYHTKHGYDHWNKNRSKDFHHDVQMRLLSDLDYDPDQTLGNSQSCVRLYT